MSADEQPIHEITWTVKHKHLMRLTKSDIADLADRLRMDEGASTDEVIEALYNSRRAEEVLADLATDRNWIDSDDAEMSFDNTIRAVTP